MTTRYKALAVTAWTIALIFKVIIPFAILEYRFQLFVEIQEASFLKLTGYGVFGVVIAALYFGKSLFRVLGKMRMNYFKGLLVTILEVAPFVILFYIVMNIRSNVEDWKFVTQWIMVTMFIGAIFSRLYDYFEQEAIEVARFKRYG